MSHDVSHHIALVRVPGRVLHDEPWKVTTLLNGCVIYRAQYLVEYDAFEYVIARGDFPVKSPGFVPVYADVDWRVDHPTLSI